MKIFKDDIKQKSNRVGVEECNLASGRQWGDNDTVVAETSTRLGKGSRGTNNRKRGGEEGGDGVEKQVRIEVNWRKKRGKNK